MRWLAVVTILCAGCLDSIVPAYHQGTSAAGEAPDLSPAPSSPTSPTSPTSPDDADAAPAAAPVDMASSTTTAGDLAKTLAAFGAACTLPSDCQSGQCQPINMAMLCTSKCTNLGAADPACPADGMCNKMGYCKP